MQAPVASLTVTASQRLGPAMMRVFLRVTTGRLASTGFADEYLRLWLPGADPAALAGSAVVSLRQFDPLSGDLAVDVVLKSSGALSNWAKGAEAGQQLHAGALTGHHTPHGGLRWQWLICDEAGLPAAARILDETPPHVPTTLIAEIAHPAHRLDLTASVQDWRIGGNGRAPGGLAARVRARPLPEGPGFIWVAAEQKTVRAIRRHLRSALDLPPAAYACVAYWIDRAEAWKTAYAALDAETRARIDALWSSGHEAEEIRDRVDALLEARGL
ncbi:siderophore-interacting protein [Pararhodobacter sp. CCB-MM2]|uniref:siderophore-interacting protein n=1 Tax=Pararhodobacter sp. CCB-MM2 TaxID=1786003 RepID=UPI00082C1B6D|nr:siderophore-interacting protein [Pararhodobacter sp. CCB-MM2]